MDIESQLSVVLRYEPETGFLFWTDKAHKLVKNKPAGYMMQNGYRQIGFKRKKYLSHRVAWLLHYGDWPTNYVDHIDGNPSNNKITNLRDVSHSKNMQNRKSATIRNKTGFLGVVKRCNKFAAHIHRDGKQIYLGHFDTAELAHQAYKEYK